MLLTMIARALLIWFLILGLAFANGGFRELVLVPALGAPYAYLLSGAMLSLMVLAVAIATIRTLGNMSLGRALAIGASWVLLTLLFEFGFGRLVQNKSWDELLDAYTFSNGNIWPVVLMVIQFSPLVALRVRSLPAKL